MINYYKYSARNRLGKVIKGVMEAPSKEILAQFLYDKGLTLKEVKEDTSFLRKLLGLQLGKAINEENLIFILKQLSAMLRAGMRVAEAIEVLATQTKQNSVRRIMFDIYFNIDAGMYLSDAMAMYPKEFPKLMTNMIRNGESAGDLIMAIENISDYYLENRELRRDILGALTMPVLYIIMGIAVTVIMITFVLPNYVTLFASTGATLPTPTLVLLNIGNFFSSYYQIMGIIFLLFATAFYFIFFRTEKGKRWFSIYAIRAPITGQIVIMYNLSNIASTLNQMVRNKMKLLDAIESATRIVKNVIYKEILTQTVENVKNGLPISLAMADHYAFTPIFVKMIALGERSGSLEEMLGNLATFNREDVKLKIARLKKSIEPMIMIFIYALAGGLVLAIMLPSLTMIQ